jgi:hypothetical protein
MITGVETERDQVCTEPEKQQRTGEKKPPKAERASRIRGQGRRGVALVKQYKRGGD